jgi:hypothetical protein
MSTVKKYGEEYLKHEMETQERISRLYSHLGLTRKSSNFEVLDICEALFDRIERLEDANS